MKARWNIGRNLMRAPERRLQAAATSQFRKLPRKRGVPCRASVSLRCGFQLARWNSRSALMLALILTFVFPALADDAAPPKPKPAQLKVSGYGLLGNLRMKRMLRILQEGKKRPEFLNANYVEDAALLLVSQLRSEGYLEPIITARLTLQDGRDVSYVWDESVEEPLPRPLVIRRLEFRIKHGVFFHFKTLKFTGLNSIPEKKARAYFIESGGLLSLKHNRVFSPEQLKHSAGNLSEALQRLGFQDAAVVYEPYKRNNRTGEVDVEIKVHEGPKYLVRSVREEIYLTNSPSISETRTNHPAQPYSKVWEQDFAQSIRTNYYRQGFPDTAVDLNTASREAQTNRVLLDVVAIVKTGHLIHVGDVTFTGQRRTKDQVVERRTPLHEGDLLDRTKAERGRYRLSRLGIFDSVELKYHNSDDDTRDVIYELKEGKQIDVHLLFGFGSYELLRGGVILDQYNVFGRAHHQELKLVQSFKASSADYTYTMPELFGENIDVFLNSSGLRREEISFTRFEYGGGAGIRKYFPSARTDVSTRYNYEVLRAEGADTTLTNIGLKDTTAAAIITDINHDRRDNPLYPRHGYKVFTDIEIASGYLGGDANYERVELSGSLHLPLSDSQWMHFGISHGIVAAVGDPSEDLPFNRRFFPGGENSVRGYQDGEAAPRDADGKVIGAETYLLGNAEFEQGITPKWSLVVFADAVGFAQELKNYPQDTTLVSVGGGLRWKTFIGPVRVEYGYNLNPRPRDPMGTLHFSLGFPF